MCFICKIVVFVMLSLTAAFFIFRPTIFPKCDCCSRVKFRSRFKYFAAVNMHLTRKGDISICSECCEKYNIRSLSDYRKRAEIKKRAEYKSKFL